MSHLAKIEAARAVTKGFIPQTEQAWQTFGVCQADVDEVLHTEIVDPYQTDLTATVAPRDLVGVVQGRSDLELLDQASGECLRLLVGVWQDDRVSIPLNPRLRARMARAVHDELRVLVSQGDRLSRLSDATPQTSWVFEDQDSALSRILEDLSLSMQQPALSVVDC